MFIPPRLSEQSRWVTAKLHDVQWIRNVNVSCLGSEHLIGVVGYVCWKFVTARKDREMISLLWYNVKVQSGRKLFYVRFVFCGVN